MEIQRVKSLRLALAAGLLTLLTLLAVIALKGVLGKAAPDSGLANPTRFALESEVTHRVDEVVPVPSPALRSEGPRPTRVWRVSGLLSSVVGVLGRAPWLLKNAADTLFFWPDGRRYGTPTDYGLLAEQVYFSNDVGGPRLHGWWVPATSPPVGTVVYCHGNHANLTHHARFVSWLPARGYNLLLFDYRGFGESEGVVTRAGVVEDTIAAIDFALHRDPERTVVFGHSLGSAVGVVAASRRPAVRAVVAESTFPSFRAAARCMAIALGPLVSLLVSKGEDPVEAVAAWAPRPFMVIAGGADRITPSELGRGLFEAAPEPKEWRFFAESTHATPWVEEKGRFEEMICEFFAASIEAD